VRRRVGDVEEEGSVAVVLQMVVHASHRLIADGIGEVELLVGIELGPLAVALEGVCGSEEAVRTAGQSEEVVKTAVQWSAAGVPLATDEGCVPRIVEHGADGNTAVANPLAAIPCSSRRQGKFASGLMRIEARHEAGSRGVTLGGVIELRIAEPIRRLLV